MTNHENPLIARMTVLDVCASVDAAAREIFRATRRLERPWSLRRCHSLAAKIIMPNAAERDRRRQRRDEMARLWRAEDLEAVKSA
jgi:hypothetical protein